jgi:chromosomal replication initiation ATPase DnaA
MTLEEIKKAVELKTGIAPDLLKDRSHRHKLVRARRLYAVAARHKGYGLKEIGDGIERDHTTVLNLIRKAEDEMDLYPETKGLYANFLNDIKSRDADYQRPNIIKRIRVGDLLITIEKIDESE